MQAVATQEPRTQVSAELQEKVLLGGDLSKLSPTERLSYYKAVCHSLGLNYLTQPFSYLSLSGKLTLYARKDCTEQLRDIKQVSIDAAGFRNVVINGVYVVTAPASLPNGRTDVATGAVSIEGLKGDPLANAMMKAETKAKRRVTLSICGLGMLDENEVETIPGAKVFHETQLEKPPQPEEPEPPQPQPEEPEPEEPQPAAARGPEATLLDWKAAMDALDSVEYLQQVWDQIVKDGTITGPQRAKLYAHYQGRVKAIKAA